MTKTVEQANTDDTAAQYKRLKPKPDWTWVAATKDKWVVSEIPEGECAAPRITGLDGKTFAAYRDGKFLGCEGTLELAKQRCAINAISERNEILRKWEKAHPEELPPFMQLTDEERAEYWRRNPPKRASAAPAPRFATGGRGDTGRGEVPPERPKKVAGPLPSGKLGRLKDGNPKKAGSGAHKRWDALLTSADKGLTVEAYVAAGGNPDTLANAVRMGWVEVKS